MLSDWPHTRLDHATTYPKMLQSLAEWVPDEAVRRSAVARMEPAGRRNAPPDDKLREMRGPWTRIALRSIRATDYPWAQSFLDWSRSID